MKQTFRWYGPNDPVSLLDVKQAGATGIVTALHHVPNGEIWSVEEIQKRKAEIEKEGLQWNVVESIPVHEDIKIRSGDFLSHIENYKKSIQNIASCGIDIICYNFMPVLDWTRTSLDYELKDGSKALYFDKIAFAAFELHILKRPGAEISYCETQKQQAETYYNKLSTSERETLTNTIIAGLPGAEEGYTLAQFQEALNRYNSIDSEQLKENLIAFLQEIIPVAAQNNILMCLHPDDPPFSIFGLPRIVCSEEDYAFIFEQIPSVNNGITFCTGSLGVLPENKLVDMFKRFANRVHFIHLRSTKRDKEGSFYEANHLDGDVDMYTIVREILIEESSREKDGERSSIPMRPDHGHQLLDDLQKETNPGYSAIGRLKGLAELRGLELGIAKSLNL